MEPTGMSIDNCDACLNSIDHNGALIPHNESEVHELQEKVPRQSQRDTIEALPQCVIFVELLTYY